MTFLSMEQVDQIDHALAERRASNACLSCGNKPVETSDHLHSLSVHTTGGVMTSAVRICDRCGYVQQYALTPLGLDSLA